MTEAFLQSLLAEGHSPEEAEGLVQAQEARWAKLSEGIPIKRVSRADEERLIEEARQREQLQQREEWIPRSRRTPRRR